MDTIFSFKWRNMLHRIKEILDTKIQHNPIGCITIRNIILKHGEKSIDTKYYIKLSFLI